MIAEQYGLEINWKKAKLISRVNEEVRPTAEETWC